MEASNDQWSDVPNAVSIVRKSAFPEMSVGCSREAFLKAMRSGEVRWRTRASEGLGNFWTARPDFIQVCDRGIRRLSMDTTRRPKEVIISGIEINIADLEYWLKNAGFDCCRSGEQLPSKPTTRRKSFEEQEKDAADALGYIARKYSTRGMKVPNYKNHTTEAMTLLRQQFGDDHLKRGAVTEIAKKRYAAQRRVRGERQQPV